MIVHSLFEVIMYGMKWHCIFRSLSGGVGRYEALFISAGSGRAS